MGLILKYFPKGLTPRPVQVEALEFIEEVWDKADVIVLNLPVASGKSYIAHAIQAWAGSGSSCILTNNNILVEQYQKDFPRLAALKGKSAVPCMNTAEPGSEFSSCAERYEWACKNKRRKYCKGCPYYTAERRFYTRNQFNYVTNYHKYVNLKSRFTSAPRHILIVDEAHNVSNAIKMFNSKQVWRHDFDYTLAADRFGRINRADLLNLYQGGSQPKNPGAWFLDELMTNAPKYIFKIDTELYRGQMRDILKAEPVDIRGLDNPVFSQGNKLILMSATIGRNDIIELGLGNRRVFYHEAESCIPADRRPIYYEPVGNIRGQDLIKSTHLVASKIRELLERYPQKGLVHATYAQAKQLRAVLKDSRVMFHTRDNKAKVYQEFRNSTDNKVLIASGLYEGVDLPDDMGRWQALAKVPWPNKGEPAIAYTASLDPNWYTWNTAKQVLQACGRICRKPDDWGHTFLLDSTFRGLYTNNKDYFPNWWQESLNGL